jgi:hypothetical protein
MQGEASGAPLDPAHRFIGPRLARAGQEHGLAAEGIAELVRRPDVGGLARRIVQGVADLGDQVREVGFREEGVRPELLVQDGLGEHLRALQRERFEQLERFGRQVNVPALTDELPGVGVENERPEANPHNGRPCKKPGTFTELP